jgi:hypothetical protein
MRDQYKSSGRCAYPDFNAIEHVLLPVPDKRPSFVNGAAAFEKSDYLNISH